MSTIRYSESLAGIRPSQLEGFFEGWPNPPTPSTHLRFLAGSSHVGLAIAEDGQVAGYISAISDGVLTAYIPQLEVREPYRGRGIGSELVRRMVERLQDLYTVDLLCDPEAADFYAPLGFQPSFGMLIRRYDKQSGALSGPTSDSSAGAF